MNEQKKTRRRKKDRIKKIEKDSMNEIQWKKCNKWNTMNDRKRKRDLKKGKKKESEFKKMKEKYINRKNLTETWYVNPIDSRVTVVHGDIHASILLLRKLLKFLFSVVQQRQKTMLMYKNIICFYFSLLLPKMYGWLAYWGSEMAELQTQRLLYESSVNLFLFSVEPKSTR